MKTSPCLARSLPAPGLRPSRRLWGVMLAALLALGAALSARAQSAGDPPGRVARLSDVAGQVWLYNADSEGWITVERNRPLTTGDRIATDNGARAEITLGSTTLRLDATTEIEIARLDDTRFNVRLRGGSVAARLRSPQALAEFALDTDEGRFRVQTVGRFRFDRFDETSDVTAFAGQAVYEARNTALPVQATQHAQFWIDGAGVPQYAIVPPQRDAFSSWNDERDRAEDRVAAARFVSPEMTGAEDLGRYGQWQQTPEYGALWVPSSVASGWAPYSVGHWAWVRPWGWTWIDDAPWGFAPFHYGRWVYHRDVWAWAPGTYVARPVYAPALVAWVGGARANLSISIGSGTPVGWFPLAPREVYVPAYRTSPRYLRDINVTHVSNPATITAVVGNRNGETDRREFANRKYAHAVTFVPAEVMMRREPVAPAAARLRNDPQLRAFVADARPAEVLTAAPVNAPPAPRPAQGRTPPRPPFEGRAPGGPSGRPDGTRSEFRPSDAPRPDAARPGSAYPEHGRAAGGRTEFGRPGDGPATAPSRGAPQVATPAPAVVAPQAVAPPVAGGTAPTSPTTAGPPFGARGNVGESMNGRSIFRGDARPDREAGSATAPQRIVPPSPVQRSAQPGETIVRPGREMRTADGAPAEARGARAPTAAPTPYGTAMPGQIPEAMVPQRTLPGRVFTPRAGDAPTSGEVRRPPGANRQAEGAVAVPKPAPVAAPGVVAPAAVAPTAAAAPPGQRAPGGEGRMTRPEAPHGRGDERRDDKAEKQK